jgi:RHS repeat-associated protein
LASKSTPSGDTTYTYDAFGSLVGVDLPDGRSIEYITDGLDRRVAKLVDGVAVQGLLYQDQLNPVAELDGAGNVVGRFVYGTHPYVPDYVVRGGGTYRIVSDHLGSVRMVVNVVTGVVAQRMDYDEFGVVLTDTNPGFQPFGFAGGLYDKDTGLVRFGARDYDAQVGRWTAKDPIRFAGGDTSIYVYVQNDPINAIDPLGKWEVSGGAYAGVGGEISVGVNPNGMPYFRVRVGIGVGAGITFDADATGPTHSAGLGDAFGSVNGFICAGVSAAHKSKGVGITSGGAITPDGMQPYTTGWSGSSGVTSGRGIGVGVTGGVEVVIGP